MECRFHDVVQYDIAGEARLYSSANPDKIPKQFTEWIQIADTSPILSGSPMAMAPDIVFVDKPEPLLLFDLLKSGDYDD